MDSGTGSRGTSSVASALASGATSPSTVASPVNPKAVGLLEAAAPMVIVQQFIDDNKEKGMPVNQKVADLKRKQEEIKAARKKVTKELKNDERKRARLRAKATQLSAEDLVQALALLADGCLLLSRRARCFWQHPCPPKPHMAFLRDVFFLSERVLVWHVPLFFLARYLIACTIHTQTQIQTQRIRP